MVTRSRDDRNDIDWSTFPESDGEPMAETLAILIQMRDLFWTLPTLFERQARVHSVTVGMNQLVYYNPLNGRDNISPDGYVAFDRRPPGPPKWQTWLEGGFPDVVFEITSSSTRHVDASEAPRGKRRLYAELGAGEYYIYDPQQETEPPFEGFESRGGRMEPLPTLPGGGIYSPLLGAELRPMPTAESERRPAGIWLRVIDPTTGEPIPFFEEEHRELLATRDRLIQETQARLAAEEARLAAEERAAQLEVALQVLLADPARRQAPGDAESTPDIE